MNALFLIVAVCWLAGTGRSLFLWRLWYFAVLRYCWILLRRFGNLFWYIFSDVILLNVALTKMKSVLESFCVRAYSFFITWLLWNWFLYRALKWQQKQLLLILCVVQRPCSINCSLLAPLTEILNNGRTFLFSQDLVCSCWSVSERLTRYQTPSAGLGHPAMNWRKVPESDARSVTCYTTLLMEIFNNSGTSFFSVLHFLLLLRIWPFLSCV